MADDSDVIVERFTGCETWGQLHRRMRDLAEDRGHYAGYPILDERHALQLAPTIERLFPKLQDATLGDDNERLDEIKAELVRDLGCQGNDLDAIMAAILQYAQGRGYEHYVNSWHSKKYGLHVTIRRTAEGRARCYVSPANPVNVRIDMLVGTIACSAHQSYAGEVRALRLLKRLLAKDRHRFRHYFLAGCFTETSPRSKLTYIFRKGRPTLVVKLSNPGTPEETMRPICALCMHPIAYYESTFAGGLCPTDDVIAHLLMMRADEHLLWRRCNQHPLTIPQSGL